jgi:hypothetical protein
MNIKKTLILNCLLNINYGMIKNPSKLEDPQRISLEFKKEIEELKKILIPIMEANIKNTNIGNLKNKNFNLDDEDFTQKIKDLQIAFENEKIEIKNRKNINNNIEEFEKNILTAIEKDILNIKKKINYCHFLIKEKFFSKAYNKYILYIEDISFKCKKINSSFSEIFSKNIKENILDKIKILSEDIKEIKEKFLTDIKEFKNFLILFQYMTTYFNDKELQKKYLIKILLNKITIKDNKLIIENKTKDFYKNKQIQSYDSELLEKINQNKKKSNSDIYILVKDKMICVNDDNFIINHKLIEDISKIIYIFDEKYIIEIENFVKIRLNIPAINNKRNENVKKFNNTNDINEKLKIIIENIDYTKNIRTELDSINFIKLNVPNGINKEKKIQLELTETQIKELEEIKKKLELSLEETKKILELSLTENDINYISEDIYIFDDNNTKTWEREFLESGNINDISVEEERKPQNDFFPKPYREGKKRNI